MYTVYKKQDHQLLASNLGQFSKFCTAGEIIEFLIKSI